MYFEIVGKIEEIEPIAMCPSGKRAWQLNPV